jgi:hypothetical protein
MKNLSKYRAYHIKDQMLCKIAVLTETGAFLMGLPRGEDQLLDGGKTIIIAPEDGRFCNNDEFVLLKIVSTK